MPAVISPVPISALPIFNINGAIDTANAWVPASLGNTQTYRVNLEQLASVTINLIYGGKAVVAKAATSALLPAFTYANGAGGVGATITANANGALPLFPFITSWAVGDIILVKNPTKAIANGVYQITQLGSSSTPFVLTRVASADTGPENHELVVFVQRGSAKGVYVQLTVNPVIGTDPLEFNSLSIMQGVLKISRAQALSAMANGSLREGRLYHVYDILHQGAYFRAWGTSKLESWGTAEFINPDYSNVNGQMLRINMPFYNASAIWGDNSSQWWNQILIDFPTPSSRQNKYAIYNGLAYKNLTGNNGVSNPSLDTTNWALEPRSKTSLAYVGQVNTIKYDIVGDVLTHRLDEEHNYYESSFGLTDTTSRFGDKLISGCTFKECVLDLLNTPNKLINCEVSEAGLQFLASGGLLWTSRLDRVTITNSGIIEIHTHELTIEYGRINNHPGNISLDNTLPSQIMSAVHIELPTTGILRYVTHSVDGSLDLISPANAGAQQVIIDNGGNPGVLITNILSYFNTIVLAPAGWSVITLVHSYGTLALPGGVNLTLNGTNSQYIVLTRHPLGGWVAVAWG